MQNMKTVTLLKVYSEVMRELRDRKVLTTWNNPVGDLKEGLVVKALCLKRMSNSAKGFDAIDSEYKKYQIKGRRLTKESKSTQLSAIRGLCDQRFDYLIAVFYDEDFTVKAAYKIPHLVVEKKANFQDYVKAHRLVVSDNFLDEEGVEDLTEVMRSTLSNMEEYGTPVTR